NKELQVFKEHTDTIYCIEFSPFSGNRYLCSGSNDKTIRLWDIENSNTLYVFNGHTNGIRCIDISPLQSNYNKNNDNYKALIGGGGYTICSGSFDQTIRVWDIETAKQLNVFKEHTRCVNCVKYGSNELGNIGYSNTILSGSWDKSVCLWDIRSNQQIQVFNGHTSPVYAVEYSPF
ncbi:protein kinase, partial [Reticulomyxa filosa]